MNIKEINEQLNKFTEEAAMYRSNQPTFEAFFKYVIKNPKAKASYFEMNKDYNLRIPSDTILHDWNKHKTDLNQWDDCISNLENIQNAGISRKKISNEDIALIRVLGYKDYGLGIMLCKNYNIITTLFADHPKAIDNWIKNGSRPQNATQPTDSSRQSQNDSDSVALSGLDPNKIIDQIKEKIKR